jgi:hypothetical protein
MEPQEQHQLWALASWLQTFPEFNVPLHPQNDTSTDADRLISVLQSFEATS